MKQFKLSMIIATIAIGTIFALAISYKMLLPFRRLVKNARELIEKEDDKKIVRNELVYINEAFDQMKEQENAIKDVLTTRELENRRMLLKGVLMGTTEIGGNIEELSVGFPYEHFMVLMIGVDNGTEFKREFNPDERMFYFLQLEEIFTKHRINLKYII